MADDLSVAIERLRTSTERLNSICDTAAQTIRDVEAFLEALHIGVWAWVEIKQIQEDDEGHHFTKVSLGYGRHKAGSFRVLVASDPPWAAGPEDMTIRLWSECTRDVKLESFEKLPDLLVELAKQVDERAAKAERTVSTVSSLLQLPKKKKGG